MASVGEYWVLLDLDDDGVFETDISDYVVRIELDTGFAAPFQAVAMVGTGSIELDNDDRRFSPFNAASPYWDAGVGRTKLQPRTGVRVRGRAYQGTGTIRDLWTGVIAALDVDGGEGGGGPERAVLRVEDYMSFLERATVSALPLQENARSDEIVAALLGLVQRGAWWLGVGGRAELGENTYLGGARFSWFIQDSGAETFPYAGDTWRVEGVTIAAALEEVCWSEGFGRFYFNASGQATFYSRHRRQKNYFAPGFSEFIKTSNPSQRPQTLLASLPGEQLVNEVVVECTPREAEGTVTTLYEHKGAAIRIPAKSSRTVRCPFVDDSGNRIGAYDVVTPVKGVDWHVESEDGIDYDGTSYPTLSFRAYAEHAEATFENQAIGPLLVTSLQVRGRRLKTFDPEAFVAVDAESQTRYGPRLLHVSAPLLNNPVVARGLGHYLMQLRRPAVYLTFTAGNESSTLYGLMFPPTYLRFLRAVEPQTGMDSEAFLIYRYHQVIDVAGRRHTTTFYCEPYGVDQVPWLLGRSGRAELGETTYLGF